MRLRFVYADGGHAPIAPPKVDLVKDLVHLQAVNLRRLAPLAATSCSARTVTDPSAASALPTASRSACSGAQRPPTACAPAASRQGGHDRSTGTGHRSRTKPSCTTVASIRPSCEKKCPVPKPRAPEALGELVS